MMQETIQALKDYLLFMGAEEHILNIFLLHDKTVHLRGRFLTVEQWKDEEDDTAGYYVETFQMQFPVSSYMEIEKIPYLFHALGVVPLNEWLTECAIGEGIEAKRAIYHLREAVRRLDDIESKEAKL